MAEKRRKRRSLSFTSSKEYKKKNKTKSVNQEISNNENINDRENENLKEITKSENISKEDNPNNNIEDDINNNITEDSIKNMEEKSFIRKLADSIPNILNSEIPQCADIKITKIKFYNFKSYKGLHEVSYLDDKFNVVVGPNGSGKSNIIDGVQFLFGYTAKKMRHLTIGNLVNDDAEDKLAYVEMNLEGELSQQIISNLSKIVNLKSNEKINEKSNEKIILKRTVTKKGHSTYFINNQSVTNKLMVKFLSYLGIDTRTNRFLILQGEIENIGLMKPKTDMKLNSSLNFAVSEKTELEKEQIEEEITKIMQEEVEYTSSLGLLEYFEQIIGTLSFNHRIQRLREIYSHISEKLNYSKPTYDFNLKELEKYTETFNTQKILLEDFGTFINKIKNFKLIKEKLENQMKKENEEKIKKLEKENIPEKKKIEKENEILKDFINQMNIFKEEGIEIQLKIKEFNNLINKIENLFNKLELKDKELEKQKEKIEKQNNSIENEITELNKKLEKIKKEIKLKENIKEKNNNENIKEKDKLKNELKAIHSKILEKENTKRTLEKYFYILKENNNFIETPNLIKNSNAEEFIKNNKNKTFKELINKEKNSEEILTNKQKSLNLNKIEYQTLKNRINSNSILSLLNSKGVHIKGVHGRVSDLIKIPSFLKQAFISANRGFLNNIIVDSKKVALECISILKRNNKRGTFLVLNNFQKNNFQKISVNKLEEGFKKITNKSENAVYPLYEFIHCENEYYELFKSNLNTYLVSNDIQKYIAFNKNVRCVNLEGLVIERSGVMYKSLKGDCQTFYNNCDLKGCHCEYKKDKKNETDINNTKKKIKKNENSTKSLSIKELENIIKEEEEEIEIIKEIGRYLKIEGEKNKKIEYLRKIGNEIEEFLSNSNINNKVEDCNKEFSNKKDSKKDVSKEFQKEVEMKIKEINKSIETNKKEENGLKKNLNNLQTEKEKLHSNKYEIENKLLKLTDKRHRKDYLTNKLEKEVKELKEEIKLTNSNKTKEEKIEILNSEITDLIKKESENKINAEKFKEKIKNLKNKLSELFNKQFERENQIEKIKNQSNFFHKFQFEDECLKNEKTNNIFIEKLAIKLPKEELIEDLNEDVLNSKYEELKFLTEKYSTSKIMQYSSSKIMHMPTPDYDFLFSINKTIKLLKKEIKKYEIDQKLSEDLNFLIETLKISRKKLFMQEFTKIKQKFKLIYRTLTFGGNAEIELINYLDPFDGLQLSVMPLKKSWTSVKNLSGGEKTLTSLSLLFAVQCSKPSPFYFLDEIDAALDYRNVSVIANFLYLEKAQFLVISLRDDMVEKANQLVGVYKVKNESSIICYKII